MTGREGRDRLAVNFMGDRIEINGEVYKPQNPGKKKTDYYYQGVFYDTIEELWVAKMLHWMQIPFLHHVKFEFYSQGVKNEKLIWCPDFIFAYPFRWVGERCNGSVIIGVEVKRTKTNGRPRRKSRHLLKARSIPILLINRQDIEPHLNKRDMELPLKPLDEYQELYLAQAG